MIRLNIHEAKTHLSRYLSRVERGERILLCRRNIPVAEIVPLSGSETDSRPVGLARGEFSLSPAFFEPLPRGLRDAFDGRES